MPEFKSKYTDWLGFQPGSSYTMFGAFFAREFRAALLNRFMTLFSGVALLAGLAPLLVDRSSSGDTAPLFLIQVVLYLVPLFSLLTGCGSAQADIEERDFLFSQPVARSTTLLGKFFALWLVLAFASMLLVLPAALGDSELAPLFLLWFHSAGTGGVFLAMGLAAGCSSNDRVKAHLVALSIWFLFLAGFDLVALVAANFPAIQNCPALWTALLALNPLDSLRVSELLSAGGVPFEPSQMPGFVRWWIGHLGVSFTIVSAGWIALSLGWSRARLESSC